MADKPDPQDVPDTIARSPAKAQRTWKKAHDSAVETYGEGERAHRAAFSALKHSFEKVGDHWEPKGRKGPSDPRAADPDARRKSGGGLGGVDLHGHSKRELYERAKDLDIQGRSKMSKRQLAERIAQKQG
ncbi:MAG: ChaB family protein [Actinomycetota bacterium]|nr:ChaB family protein [Actinomycetota bacterium]